MGAINLVPGAAAAAVALRRLRLTVSASEILV